MASDHSAVISGRVGLCGLRFFSISALGLLKFLVRRAGGWVGDFLIEVKIIIYRRLNPASKLIPFGLSKCDNGTIK